MPGWSLLAYTQYYTYQGQERDLTSVDGCGHHDLAERCLGPFAQHVCGIGHSIFPTILHPSCEVVGSCLTFD